MAVTEEQQQRARALLAIQQQRAELEAENAGFGQEAARPNLGEYGQTPMGQGMSGVNEGIAWTLGAPVSGTAWLLNQGAGLLDAGLGTDLPRVENPVGGIEFFQDVMSPTIAPPTDDGAGQFARRIGQDVGASLIPGLGIASRAARPLSTVAMELAAGAGSGVGAGAANAIAPDNMWAEMAGQLAGGLGAGGLIGAGRRAITPMGAIPDARLRAAQALRNEGVDLTAGQVSGSNNLRYAESELGGGRAQDITAAQAEQFTNAAMSRAGISGLATPDNMASAFQNIGRTFDDLAARTTLPLDRQLGVDLGNVIYEYNSYVPESMRAPAVQSFLDDLVRTSQASGGALTGDVYQAYRSRLDRMARAAQDPQLSDALFGMRNALDDATERFLAQNDPQALAQWQQARADYRNLLVLEQAAQGAGEAAAQGIISPARLRQAAQNVYGRRSYVTGNNPYSELAQAGQTLLSPLPQSGTAPRTAVRNMFMGAPAIGGVLAGGATGDIMTGALGAAAGAAAPALAGRALMSDPVQNWLLNQVALPGPRAEGAGAGLIAALLAGQSQPNARLTPQELIAQQLASY